MFKVRVLASDVLVLTQTKAELEFLVLSMLPVIQKLLVHV